MIYPNVVCILKSNYHIFPFPFPFPTLPLSPTKNPPYFAGATACG